jgi:hypothetical protein
MKWILYIMLFSTPAANVTNKADKICLQRKEVKEISEIIDCRQKFEGRHVWSLQTTSQMEFSAFEGCFGTLDQLMADSNVASTMTSRSYCICDDEKGKCPTERQLAKSLADLRTCESAGKSDCRANTSKTVQGFIGTQQEQRSSAIRLYPPPKVPPQSSTPAGAQE